SSTITIANNTRLELASAGPAIVLDQAITLTGTGGTGSNACLWSISGNNQLNGELIMTGTTRIEAAAGQLTLSGSPFALRSSNTDNRTLTLGGDGDIIVNGELSQGNNGGAGT